MRYQANDFTPFTTTPDSTLQAVETIAEPTWITGTRAPIFAWIHRPADGLAAGAVVLCPPLGREHLSAYRALRLLADRLASVGLLALRFDYRGTGDSAGGAAEAGQVAAWSGSVAEAAGFAARAGAGPLMLVGLRLGATLAVEAMSQIEHLDALVLWDPCPSPAVFLREQHLLHRLGSGSRARAAPASGWLETPGMAFSHQTVEDLRALQWSDVTAARLGERCAGGAGVLLLSRANEPLSPFLKELSDHPGVDHSQLTGQRELLETSTSPGVVPESTLDSITSFLARRSREARPCDMGTSPTACISHGDGEPVVERAVRLGARGLFGIVTEQLSPNTASPPVLLVTVAAHPHVGPSRQWVELARRWAANGARVLRFDVSGVGDSEDLDGPKAYTRRSVSDVVEAAAAMSPDAPGNVILFGMCSGAWAASVAGVELAARAVYLVNQDQWHDGTGTWREASTGSGPTGPAAMFERLTGLGVAVTVVFGPEDEGALRGAMLPPEQKELFEPAETGGASKVRFLPVDELDHDLLTRSACEALAEHVTPLIIGSCGLSPDETNRRKARKST